MNAENGRNRRFTRLDEAGLSRRAFVEFVGPLPFVRLVSTHLHISYLEHAYLETYRISDGAGVHVRCESDVSRAEIDDRDERRPDKLQSV